MSLPWTSRAELYTANARAAAAENLRLEANVGLAQSETARQREHDHYEARIIDLTERLADSEAERKILLDRIVQMSGQPALYHQPEAAPANPAAASATNNIPGPARKISFDEVHAVTRKALKNGTYSILKTEK
jgi:hypothetical protein